jgi:hypothetical protein
MINGSIYTTYNKIIMLSKEEDRIIKQTWFLIALGLGAVSIMTFYLGLH